MEHPRICSNIANFTNAHVNQRSMLIQAYGQWLQDHISRGWDAYFLTFAFNSLPGSVPSKLWQMHQKLEFWYQKLATRTVRKPKSPKWVSFLPKAILVPDLPVPKHAKQRLRDVIVNDGLHVHGLVVATRDAPRLPDPLDVHIRQHRGTYVTGQLRHLDVQPITHAPEYVAEYAMKALKRYRFSADDIWIFPRDISELPSRAPGPTRSAGEKPIYDFQRK